MVSANNLYLMRTEGIVPLVLVKPDRLLYTHNGHSRLSTSRSNCCRSEGARGFACTLTPEIIME